LPLPAGAGVIVGTAIGIRVVVTPILVGVVIGISISGTGSVIARAIVVSVGVCSGAFIGILASVVVFRHY